MRAMDRCLCRIMIPPLSSPAYHRLAQRRYAALEAGASGRTRWRATVEASRTRRCGWCRRATVAVVLESHWSICTNLSVVWYLSSLWPTRHSSIRVPALATQLRRSSSGDSMEAKRRGLSSSSDVMCRWWSKSRRHQRSLLWSLVRVNNTTAIGSPPLFFPGFQKIFLVSWRKVYFFSSL